MTRTVYVNGKYLPENVRMEEDEFNRASDPDISFLPMAGGCRGAVLAMKPVLSSLPVGMHPVMLEDLQMVQLTLLKE